MSKGATGRQCSTDVHDTFGVSFHQCDRRGVVERGGKPYCKQHDPIAVAERRSAWILKREAVWKAEKDAGDRRDRIIAAHPLAVKLAEEVLKPVDNNLWLDTVRGIATEFQKARGA